MAVEVIKLQNNDVRFITAQIDLHINVLLTRKFSVINNRHSFDKKSHTIITGDFNNTRDGHHVSRHTAVHQILRQLTFNGARDSP